MHRSLHIVDIENLTGADRTCLRAAHEAGTNYRRLAEIGPMDQIIVGTNMSPDYRLTIGLQWPGAQMVSGHGRDGADRALLAAVDPAWVVRRGFARVVIGSGDRCFAALGAFLKRAGVMVHVIGRTQETHHSLWSAANRVVTLPALEPVTHDFELPAATDLVTAA